MKFLCTNCNYIYDEASGDLKEDIEAGTLFTELPYDFSCPNCYFSKDNFMEVKEEILYAQDKNFLSPLEKTHIPVINFLENKAIVEIGEINHPMIEGHYIYSIGLYDEYGDLIEEKFLNVGETAKVTFEISDLDDFEIRVKCSVDGLWSSGIIKNS